VNCPLGYFFSTEFPHLDTGHVKANDAIVLLLRPDTVNGELQANVALSRFNLQFEPTARASVDYVNGPYQLIMGFVRQVRPTAVREPAGN
jgi:hypothetical protein